MKGAATAVEETPEELLHAAGPGDALLHFGDFASSELFPARADGSVVAEAVEKESCFAEGEAQLPGEADEQDAVEGSSRIAALAAGAVGGRE